MQQTEEVIQSWKKYVETYFPEARKRVYFIPYYHFNKVAHYEVDIAGQPFLVKGRNNDGSEETGCAEKSFKKGNQCRSSNQHDVTSIASPMKVSSRNQKKPSGKPTTQSNELLHVQESDEQDDQAHGWFLKCLKLLFQNSHHSSNHEEGMVVISHLDITKYLCVLDKAAAGGFKNASAKTISNLKHRRGEIDVLIIHPRYGLIVAEVKSVGSKILDPEEALLRAVEKRLITAATQLAKLRAVLKHFMTNDPINKSKDFGAVPIILTLIFPHVTRGLILKVLEANQNLAKDLRDCFKCKNNDGILDRCLCVKENPPFVSSTAAGRMSTLDFGGHWRSSVSALKRFVSFLRREANTPQSDMQNNLCKKHLQRWWVKAVVQANETLQEDLYEELLARFVGYATVVDVPTARKYRQPVKTEREAVAQTGLVMSSLTLIPSQLQVLRLGEKEQPYVHLYGPPGTGKTVCLIVKGAEWLQQGKDVHLLSLSPEGVVVSMHIEGQIRTLASSTSTGSLRRHSLDITKMSAQEAIASLKKAAKGSCGILYVIIDEITKDISRHFNDFFHHMKQEFDLHIWAAGIPHLKDLVSAGMHSVSMTSSLRCPPQVLKEVIQSDHLGSHTVDSQTPGYSKHPGPDYTDAGEVIWIHHACHKGHAWGFPEECKECGQDIADLLQGRFKISIKEPSSPHFRDVLILCNEPSEECAMVRALVDAGVPVQVLTSSSGEDVMKDVAGAISDKVTVTHHSTASGLERSIVIGTGQNLNGLLVHGIGKITQSAFSGAFVFTVLLLLSFGAEIAFSVLDCEPKYLVLKTTATLTSIVAVGALSLRLCSACGLMLSFGLILTLIIIIGVVLLAHLFDENAARLVAFFLLNVVGGCVGCRFSTVFPIVSGIVFGNFMGGLLGKLINDDEFGLQASAIVVTFICALITDVGLFHAATGLRAKRAMRLFAFVLIYRGSFGGVLGPDRVDVGWSFTNLALNASQGFCAGVITSMLGNMVWEFVKGRSRRKRDFMCFVIAAFMGYIIMEFLLSHLLPVMRALRMLGMALSMATGVTSERILVKKSRDRLHAMSRSTAILVWIDEPIPRLMCL